MPEFRYLRCDHCCAIRLIRIIEEIFLVVGFGWIESRKRSDRVYDRAGGKLLGGQLSDRFVGNAALLIAGRKDRRTA